MLALLRAASWIREMHFSVVALAERKAADAWHAAARIRAVIVCESRPPRWVCGIRH